MLATYNKDIDKITFGKNNIKITDDITNALSKLKPGMIATSDDLRGLASHLGTSNQGFIDFCQNIKDSKIQLKDGQTYLQAYEEQLNSTGFSFKNLGKSALNGLKSLGSGVLNMLGGMAIGWSISTGVSLIGKGIDSLITTKKETEEARQGIIQAGETARQTINQIKSDFNSTKSIVDEIGGKYAEFAQKVGNLGTAKQNQGLLSNDEYAEFLDISNQLADLFPTLKNGYDDNGNAILDLNGNVQTITSSLYGLLDAEKAVASAEMQEKMSDIYSGFKTEQSDYSDKYNNILGQKNGLDTFYTKFTNSDNDVSSDQYATLFGKRSIVGTLPTPHKI